MSTSLLMRVALIVALAASNPAPVWAADRCEGLSSTTTVDTPQSIDVYLARVLNCVSGESDDAAIAKTVNSILDADRAPNARAAQALTALRSQLSGLSPALEPGSARDATLVEIGRALQGVEAGESAGTGAVAASRWDWTSGQGVNAVPQLDLSGRLAAACSSAPTSGGCAGEKSRAVIWLRSFVLVRRTLSTYSEPSVAARIGELERRVKMWRAYRDEALPLFWWEDALNSELMRRADTRTTDASGKNPAGYEAIPTSQVILLHPGAALQWRDAKAAGANEAVKPAVYVELIGVNRWSWDDTTGQMVGGRGVSLMMTYASREDGSDVGYGIMFHSRLTKQFSLGVARSGGDMMYMVNVDLAEYFKENLPYWKRASEKLDRLREQIGALRGQ